MKGYGKGSGGNCSGHSSSSAISGARGTKGSGSANLGNKSQSSAISSAKGAKGSGAANNSKPVNK